MGDTARRLSAAGVTRLIVGGGETSGAVVTALGVSAFSIGPQIDPGVPALAVEGAPLRLALKSGNFGAKNFYEKAARVLGGRRGVSAVQTPQNGFQVAWFVNFR